LNHNEISTLWHRRPGEDAHGLTRTHPSGKPVPGGGFADHLEHRVAVAEGWVRMRPETLALVEEGTAKKGDVLGIARLAGIMGAKKTADLIPLCHPLPVTKVAVDLTLDPDLPGVRIEATVKTTGQTGVEMEALTAVSTAALTVYDMAKAVDKAMEIGGIRVTLKDGGKSGRYEAK
jgi:cyclic pyranopterin phosphate synthase